MNPSEQVLRTLSAVLLVSGCVLRWAHCITSSDAQLLLLGGLLLYIVARRFQTRQLQSRVAELETQLHQRPDSTH